MKGIPFKLFPKHPRATYGRLPAGVAWSGKSTRVKNESRRVKKFFSRMKFFVCRKQEKPYLCGMKPYTLNGQTIPAILLELSRKGNQHFTETLHPGIGRVLGCRMPDLRLLAKAIARTDWQDYLRSSGTQYMEERTLFGLVLGYIIPNDFKTYLQLVDDFTTRINSWSVCDAFTFAGGLNYVDEHRRELWDYICGKARSDEEYTIRFGVVMSMRYFTDKEHLAAQLRLYESIHHEGYYARMAVAWAVAECFIRFPEETMPYLRHNRLDKFTHNKALQKITESFRVNDTVKQIIRQLKR